VRGSRRAVGLAEGRGESWRPATARPRVDLGRLRRVTLAALSLSTARVRPRSSWPGPSGPARRRCALETVEIVVTTPDRLGALQDPRKDVISLRNLFSTRIALRLDESDQVDMVLGDGARDRGALADEISPLPAIGAGVAYVRLEASPPSSRPGSLRHRRRHHRHGRSNRIPARR
jgi:hypothetical protein